MNKFKNVVISFIQTLAVWLVVFGLMWLVVYVYRERGLAATGGMIVLILSFGGTWIQNYEKRQK